ncbi:DNA topoisomerase I [Megamonas hypermegale]|uniref:type I DNA topoisomerase n=1 Tax=Megamonas hypermegale TaxID=158847 RepID=UPI000B385E5D|nr:type I DNA topoisomerase [Megamonas hypermegale]MBM6760985.1 type I DNA topoisomerase [Megamonas hypermegale]MBM6833120.1 type I DNA topoisomerase [Megamonas hypermegale]OUO41214.1 DNA topoisomerase I [Megamonas hypermegale]HJG07959.1 type I DNA topoisomerase [Megamonas hypermegale]
MNKKTLVVVESPTKAKTIEKYLGNKKYTVMASMGHLRDLPKSQFGIDVEHDFTPKYINIRGKGDLIKALKKEAKKSEKVYLASDPDREGEAIAWHLAYILGIDEHEKCRIVFNEITKPAIQEAVKNPKAINIDRVDAQQARRMLDRIVGYKLSPLLWKKIRKGLSAGRVQSVTVKMICDREKEIQKFKSEEYWTVDFKFKKKPRSNMFAAELIAIDDKKLMISAKKEDIKIASKTEADDICLDIENVNFKVIEIKKRQRQRKAPAPFTTSSLQQDAARKLGFTSRKTMMVAQQLYEGISLGRKGPTGLITYMRTDSTRISDIALNEARTFIEENFGKEYLPEKPNIYVAGKASQDAHEAVRPTNIKLTPASVEQYLTKEQLKLYKLIWQRFLGSQMLPANYDMMSVTMQGGKYTAKATGSKMKFAGFTAVYNDSDNKKEKDVILPDLAEGDELSIQKIEPMQHFTEPPARYNDASLVKTLEEKGIGRPSTYAPIIETILARGYVVRSDKKFEPTDLGFVVVDLLEKYFKEIVDEKFTADLEYKLDEIAVGKIEKNTLLREFYVPFEKTLEHAEEEIGEVEVPDEVSDVQCELCGRMMVVKQGRYGKFLACPGFPECRNTKPIIKDTGVKCPKCGGKIIERRTRRGIVFYGCENYPKCDYVSWDMPLTTNCKECGSFLFRHRFKNGRTILYCSNDECKTRKEDTPINREINKMKEKEQKAAAAKLEEARAKAAEKENSDKNEDTTAKE